MAETHTLSAEVRAHQLALLAMAWDGQWFLKVYKAYGWEAAAQLNASVRAAFGRIEMRRMLHVLGKRAADDLAEAIRIIEFYFDQVLAAGFEASSVVGGEQAEIVVSRCAALEGAKRAGLERHDQACMACRGLWLSYMEVLQPGVPFELDVTEQMGHGAPRCRIVIRGGRVDHGEE